MFAFRLALQLGFPHPDHLLSQLTGSQLSEWMAYSSIEPFGEYRSELRHGQQMAAMHNLKGVKKSDAPAAPNPEAWRALDFMNFIDRHEEPEREMTTEELEAYADQVFGI